MALRQSVSTDQAPEAIGPYSQGIRSGSLLFCSGQIPLDPSSGELVKDDIEGQTRRCLENLAAVCEAAGGSLADAVRCTVYLTDMGDFARVNEVYGSFFEGRRAAGARGDRRGGAPEGRRHRDRRDRGALEARAGDAAGAGGGPHVHLPRVVREEGTRGFAGCARRRRAPRSRSGPRGCTRRAPGECRAARPTRAGSSPRRESRRAGRGCCLPSDTAAHVEGMNCIGPCAPAVLVFRRRPKADSTKLTAASTCIGTPKRRLPSR